MDFSLLVFTLVCLTHTQAQIKHHDIALVACSDSDKEYMYGISEEEWYYSDYVKKQMVNALPPFVQSISLPEGTYQQGEADIETCRHNIGNSRKAFKDQPEPQDVPQNSIYPRDDVNLGSENTLICHSIRFFPPNIRIRWTKNTVDVTDQSSLSQYYPNDDNTFNQFSHLPFTPQKGDVYTCRVEHEALETPDTKTWEVDVELPSVGPSVFCGVGLVVGLLGVATGTFFLVKGNQCN